MNRVAAGAIGLAIAAILIITFVKHEGLAGVTSSPGSTLGYSQGKYDPIKPLPGTTNVPINPFNQSVPIAQPQESGGDGTSDMDED
jgi:hypothetical protein